MFRKILIMALVAAVLGGGYAFWMFNKPHEDIRKLDTTDSFTAVALAGQFEVDRSATDARLFDQVIEIQGTIHKLNRDSEQAVITFDPGGDYIIQAYLPVEGNELKALEEGSNIRLKCKYSGYFINDDAFMIPADIKLEPCYIQE